MKTPNPMNAVIYARYSSHAQNEQSIEGQIRDCLAFAEREGLKVVGEYIDRAISGRHDDRPDFQRMIEEAKSKEFQYVIVWKLDRFSRNRYDSAIYKHILKQCDVRVLSAMENIGYGDESIILEAIIESMAEYYSRDLSKKIIRGKRETIMKGRFPGGSLTFGYKLVDGKVEVDEEKAPAIVYAFERYAEGASKKQIFDELRAKGCTAANGGELNKSSFQHALKNRKYTGYYEYDGERYDVYPAIISEELFERVQAKLAERGRSPAAGKRGRTETVEYLLQGKIFCGECGAKMIGDSGTSKGGKKHHYYTCGNRKREKSCGKTSEQKGYVEWLVTEQTAEYVTAPGRAELIAKAVVAEYEKEFNKGEAKALERKIDKIGKDIRKATMRMIQTDSDALVAETERIVEELTAQKKDMERELSKMRLACGKKLNVAEVKAWIANCCHGEYLDGRVQKRIAETFINSVFLYDDKAVIFINLQNGRQVTYIEVADYLDDLDDGESGGVRISRRKLE
jgi:DNA invertase Pin-like site-specific DNA recombinase